MDDYLPGTSWEIAEEAIAAHSQDPEIWDEPGLLDMACFDSGEPILQAGAQPQGLHIVITPVEWRSAPWLGRYRRGVCDIEAFLFQTRDEAAEWARRRIQEVAAEYAAHGETLTNWPVATVVA